MVDPFDDGDRTGSELGWIETGEEGEREQWPVPAQPLHLHLLARFEELFPAPRRGQHLVLHVVLDVQRIDLDPPGPRQLEGCLPHDLVQPGGTGDPSIDMAADGVEVECAVIGEEAPAVDDEKPAQVHRGSLGFHAEEAGVEGAESLGGEWSGGRHVLAVARGSPAPPTQEIVESLIEAGDQFGRLGHGDPIDVEPDTGGVHMRHQTDVERRSPGGSERIETADRCAGDRERLLHPRDVGQRGVTAFDHAGHDADRQRRRELLQRGGQALTDPDRRLVRSRAQAAAMPS